MTILHNIAQKELNYLDSDYLLHNLSSSHRTRLSITYTHYLEDR